MMDQEDPTRLSLQDEVSYLISRVDQQLEVCAPTSIGDVPANSGSSLRRLRDLLQITQGEGQTGGVTSHASDVKKRLALHRADYFDALLQAVLDVPDNVEIRRSLTSLGGQVLGLGFGDVDEARRLIVAATTSATARKLLYGSATSDCSPSVLTFDLSHNGHASLEFAELNQTFPGSNGAQGYSIMLWMRIDRFDDACHTTLFGACDPTHKCFLLLYLDRKHHSLILQTSVASFQPSVRFRVVTFEQHKLYHIALVHRKSRREAPGKALLYVDGILREQVRCSLPDNPPSPMPSNSSNNPQIAEATPVRAFFGTPRDLSPSSQPQTLLSQWSLASGHLINHTLTDETIFMYYQLGPAYRGNFQDCLGSFLTYQASTMVNLHKEQEGKGSDDPSALGDVFKLPGKLLCPERQFVLSISPMLTRQNAKIQPPQTQRTSVLHPRPSSGSDMADVLVLNAAAPSLQKALKHRAGSGTCEGGVMLSSNLNLQDCCWRLCGSVPVALQFVKAATTMQELTDATLCCFRMCKDDWRNSEAFERSSGFGVLSWLLQQKTMSTNQSGALPKDWHIDRVLDVKAEIEDQALDLLHAIISASIAGSGSGEAVIVNPLAYRMLVVDNELWQHTGSETQRMLYNHLLSLISTSKHRKFNMRRLLRMRLPKRLIEILKIASVRSEACNSILQIFHALLDHSASSDTLRSLALYITYALRGANRIKRVAQDQNIALAQPERGLRALQMLHLYLCQSQRADNVQRFYRSVTSKWLLYLLSTDDEQVFQLTLSILTRTILSSSDEMKQRFEAKRGPLILERMARTHWHRSKVWASLLALFLRIEAEYTNIQTLDDFGQWLAACSSHPTSHDLCSFAWDAIAAMLSEGLKASHQDHPSLSFDTQSSAGATIAAHDTFLYAVGLLSALQDNVPEFRHFLTSSQGFTSLLHALHHGWAEDSSSKGPSDTVGEIRGSSASVEEPAPPVNHRQRIASEYVVLPARGQEGPQENYRSRPFAPQSITPSARLLENRSFKAVSQILEMAAVEQILHVKDFTGLGLFLKAPGVGSSEFCSVNSAILSRIIARLSDAASNDTSIFHQPQSLINLARFVGQCTDATKEGWFQDGTLCLLRFLAAVVGRLEDRNVRALKSVRLCSQAVAQMRETFIDLAIFELSLSLRNLSLLGSEPYVSEDKEDESGLATKAKGIVTTTSPLDILCQTNIVAFALGASDHRALEFAQSSHRMVGALLFLVYQHVARGRNAIANEALQLFRYIASANHVEALACFSRSEKADDDPLGTALVSTVLNHDDNRVLSYVSANRAALDEMFSQAPKTAFEGLQRASNRRTCEKAEQRIAKREQRLNKAHLQQLEEQHSFTEYDIGFRNWTENIHYSETFTSVRRRQDRDVNAAHFAMTIQEAAKTFDELIRLQSMVSGNKWALDDVEGRDRVRLRLCRAEDASDLSYQPKRSSRSNTLPSSVGRPSATDRRRSNTISLSAAAQPPSPLIRHEHLSAVHRKTSATSAEAQACDEPVAPGLDLEEGQTVDDKNRKVMRSLRHGEQVLEVYNVSRIRGLEAFEGLFIVGEKALYLIDDMFQRPDGEIVATSEAPDEQRDPYVSMISGRNLHFRSGSTTSPAPSAKHWSWSSVISISKRKFLLRAVALEIFLVNGRSYLLTTPTIELRDKLFSAMEERSPALRPTAASNSEPNSWRLELLVSPPEPAHTMTGRFANVLNRGPSVAATAKWAKGEMSNFQYLMLVNTLAGRTFNDLTQYPVFPWVLSDYTSKELDLTNPRTFRDLSKPMGCQRPEREAAFRDRYRAFLDMNDEKTPAFNYGTHYSTAITVSSYLIRLQPYVDSYLLLQGGSFDHADRLFYSVERAWSSASQTNMTDVRELTPEFFYLPDMFCNINHYDFGRRETTGDLINDVQLPPWAKGDPNIFVAKHREALESPFVSQNLHQWIDLIFGFKQRGEAAIEATNVFHHLSYQGAIDLDQIDDQMERMATIGIIHNFGQTPQQIFTKPHSRRESTTIAARKLHRSIGALATKPTLIFEYHEAIAEIELSRGGKEQRLTCAGSYRAFMHPMYSMTMDWGFVDSSVRFWNPDTKKPAGIFEQLHQDTITAAMFAGTILVTASQDCTVALWHVSPKSEPVGLQLASTLFGHRSPIIALAVSSVLNVVASADNQGRVILWDLTTHQVLREVEIHHEVKMMKINSTNGHIAILCKTKLKLYTVNCNLILDQEIAQDPEDILYCCAFYETSGDDWMDTELIFTGHRHGIANIWKVCFDSKGHWQLLLLKQLQHIQRPKATSTGPGSGITALWPADTSIYAGDELGRVYEWKAVR